MTKAEIYEFDLNGIIIYPGILIAEQVVKMNEILDSQMGDEFPRSFSFIDSDSCFMDLMAHPGTLQIIRHMIGDWLRLDHAYGLQMTRQTEIGENLHGGPRTDNGEHQYQWLDGTMYNGLIVVMYALEDVNDGDGGFICVPGSHKANLHFKPEVSSHLVANPSLKAGDMLIFTEALVHGTRKWTSQNRRRSLLYKYSPGHSTWGNPENMTKLLPHAQNDLHRSLLRPPSVGSREAVPFPEVEG